MKALHKTLAGAAVVLAAAGMQWGPVQARGQAAPAAQRMVLAVVNLAKVFDALNEKMDNASELDKITKSMNDEQTKRKDEIEKMTGDLERVFKVGSPEYRAAQDDILMKGMQLQAFSQFAQQKIGLETRLRYAKLYSSVNKAVEEYAKAAGIVMVFVADDADIANTRDTGELLNRITARKVMYADPNYDISGKIIEKMNTDYRLGSRK